MEGAEGSVEYRGRFEEGFPESGAYCNAYVLLGFSGSTPAAKPKTPVSPSLRRTEPFA